MNINKIEESIGYTFKNKKLLERAFTHSSVDTRATKNYQSLEFFGDSILDFLISKRLLELYPDAHEGDLTKMRASIVSSQPLADEIVSLGLYDEIEVGRGENKAQIVSRGKIKSDIYESLLAAIYLDSGSIDEAERFVLRTLEEEIRDANKASNAVDFKSALNELCSKEGKRAVYKTISQSGPPHDPTFVCSVSVGKSTLGEGEGRSLRSAQQQAAKAAIDALKKNK